MNKATRQEKHSNDQQPHQPPANLAIWGCVQRTNPEFARRFTNSDGFEGTAINPTYSVYRATKLFGPCGIGWGYDIVSEAFVNGGPLAFDEAGNPLGQTVIHKLQLRLWFLHEGKKGEVTHFGQTPFVGNGPHGVFTDEEAPKKSLTDALTKCLSMLGFSADVWLGRYDDNRFVNQKIGNLALAGGERRI